MGMYPVGVDPIQCVRRIKYAHNKYYEKYGMHLHRLDASFGGPRVDSALRDADVTILFATGAMSLSPVSVIINTRRLRSAKL